MTMYIVLPHALETQVDDEDYMYLSQFKWHINNGYAMRLINGKLVTMQNVILQIPGLIDHKDRVRLNNCRYNLRPCTQAQNCQNLILPKGISGYRGVKPSKNRWQAYIRNNSKQMYLGTYETAEVAAKMYDVAARKYHGEFAILNF
jgi:hypothetical protein